MVAMYIRKIVHNMNVTLCIMCMFLIGQVSGLVKNIDTGVFSSDTLNALNVKRLMMVLLIEIYLFIEL